MHVCNTEKNSTVHRKLDLRYKSRSTHSVSKNVQIIRIIDIKLHKKITPNKGGARNKLTEYHINIYKTFTKRALSLPGHT